MAASFVLSNLSACACLQEPVRLVDKMVCEHAMQDLLDVTAAQCHCCKVIDFGLATTFKKGVCNRESVKTSTSLSSKLAKL
eukprot:4952256-Amphidinium_carterae.2